MLNFLSLMNQEGSLGIGEACIYALIGFLVVVAGITLIIIIIQLIGLLMRKTNNLEFLTRKGRKNKKSVNPTAEVNTAETSDDEITDEVKAAIVAALMFYYSEESPKSEFIIKRIRKI